MEKKYIRNDIILLILTLISFIYIDKKINNLNKKVLQQDSLYRDFYYSVVDSCEKKAYLVTVTTYNPTKKQTDNSPFNTSCNFKIDSINPFKQRIIGLSRDLLQDFYYGEKVIIENTHSKFDGEYKVVDCANIRLIRTVDICIGRNQLGGRFENAVLKHKY